MEINTQKQEAGGSSVQMQNSTITYNNYYKYEINYNINENAAREIFEKLSSMILHDKLTEKSYDCANKRIQQFENLLIPRMQGMNGALDYFADPAFQLLLKRAQLTAAAIKAERIDDYELLSELLLSYIEEKESRKVRTGIEYAVKTVDKIDDEALCALTITYTLDHIIPILSCYNAGLKVFNDILNDLLYVKLPINASWIDHLNILGTIRLNQITLPYAFDKKYTNLLDGYHEAGIKKDSDEYSRAKDILLKASLDYSSYLVPNEFLQDYVKLPLVSKQVIQNSGVIYVKNTATASFSEIKITDEMRQAFESVWNLYTKDAGIREKCLSTFLKTWNSYPTLKELREWWDSITVCFEITQIGEALAYANARNRCSEIPKLDLESIDLMKGNNWFTLMLMLN